LNSAFVLNVTALALSAVSLAISVALALRQVATMRHANQLPVFVELTQEFRDEDFQHAEYYVTERLAKEQSPKLGISGLPEVQRDAVSRVVTLFSTFAALTSFRMVPESMIVALFGFRANRVWTALEPVITREREIRGDPEYLVMYEHLVRRIRDNWPPGKMYPIKLQGLNSTKR
jgi:hypothetical protein